VASQLNSQSGFWDHGQRWLKARFAQHSDAVKERANINVTNFEVIKVTRTNAIKLVSNFWLPRALCALALANHLCDHPWLHLPAEAMDGTRLSYTHTHLRRFAAISSGPIGAGGI
jgi:hypothetical protein